MKNINKRRKGIATFKTVLSGSFALGAILVQHDLSAQECEKTCYPKRWVYWTQDILHTDFKEDAFRVIARDAYEAGFNGIVMAGSGNGSFHKLATVTQENCEEKLPKCLGKLLKNLVAVAVQEHMEIFPTGGGPEVPALLDPNLEEAFPITTSYTLSGKVAEVTDGKVNQLGEDDFSNGLGEWDVDEMGNYGGVRWEPSSIDGSPAVLIQGKTAPDSNQMYLSRLMRDIILEPNTPYQLSFTIRADNMTDPNDKKKLKILIQNKAPDNNALYNFATLGKGTKDNGEWYEANNTDLFTVSGGWQTMNVQFNSGQPGIDGSAIARIYFGFWSKMADSTGAIRIKGMKLQKIGILHPVPRANLPSVEVKTKEGLVVDPNTYPFALQDASAGYAGRRLVFTGNVPQAASGQLLVKWRQSSKFMFKSFPESIACEDGIFAKKQQQVWNGLRSAFFGDQKLGDSIPKYLLDYDEIRVANWDVSKPNCSLPSAYDYINQMIRGVQNTIIAKENPVQTIVWNDMLDPHANAVDRYFQVNGSNSPVCPKNDDPEDEYKYCFYSQDRGSSTGLQYNTVIANWIEGSNATQPSAKHPGSTALRIRSLTYFKDFPQLLALFYDDKSDDLESVKSWLDAVSSPPPGVVFNINGIMYTTWEPRDYTKLAKVAEKIRQNKVTGPHWPK